MLEKWNQFVYELCEAKSKDVDEDIYHSLIEMQLQLLGWAKYKGEICHKPNIPIGNSKFIQPDILIKEDDEDLFVIEVKRPVHTQTERERVQLESYMRQLKIEVGIYIGEHIEVFYDKPKNKDAVSVLKIPLEIDNKQGSKFVEKFSKELFSRDAIVDFCEERIKEMQRQDNLNKIKESLMADAQTQIAESLKPYLMEKYGGTISEEEVKGMLATLRFTATHVEDQYRQSTPAIIPVPIDKHITGTLQQRILDNTSYSLDGGPFLKKNRFVYAVVSTYVQQHPSASFTELENIFRPEYQGSCGVIRTMDHIQEKNYKGKRYFTEEDNVLQSGDGIRFAVSTQWGKGNLPNIIELAKKLGYKVEASSTEETQNKRPTTKQNNFINCFLTRNADAKGKLHLFDQSLTVLKGSKVNPHHLDKISESGRKKRDWQLAEYTKEINGERIVKEDILFDTPSGASQFCIGGSSNGWKDWKDANNNELSIYRKENN
ncbi:MAG: DUF4357 domain-containing protein [Paludibacteraceae bacterium]|nr:DUF4357 domain-containing protein [Paludibacteraceae bacterium]